MLQILLSAIFYFLIFDLAAQGFLPIKHKVTVNGSVISKEDGTNLPCVSVIWDGHGIATYTDKYGQFQFPELLSPGDSLLFAFIGLKTEKFIVPLFDGTVLITMDVDVPQRGDLFVTEPQRNAWKKLKFRIHRIAHHE